MLMRMVERFSGCRVLSYCVMTNHLHLLLEAPAPPTDGEFGLSEDDLLHRLGGLYSRARRGLYLALGLRVADWQEDSGAGYRRLLPGLGQGRESSDEAKERQKKQGRRSRRGMSRAGALAELREGKKLSKATLLRCRVRYLTDGLVLGSREFVDKVLEEKRSWFGPKRKTGARGLPVGEKSLFSLRELKVRALE